METFFTSDTHFGHENIIKYCNRPFSSAEEMNETMIKNWNSVVNKGDLVYHLGDFVLGVEDKIEYAREIRGRLNGQIQYIMVNHDPSYWLHPELPGSNPGFLSIKAYDEVVVKKQKIVLFHYGMRTWHHDLRGVWHLYGHSHGGLKPYGKSLDVGVDSWNFTPVHFDVLKKVMDARAVGDHPMFEEYKQELVAERK